MISAWAWRRASARWVGVALAGLLGWGGLVAPAPARAQAIEPASVPQAAPASAVAAVLAAVPELPLPAAAASAAEAAATLVINQRPVLRFRASLLGDGPAARAELARSAVAEVLAQGGAGTVTHTDTGDAVRFEVDGTTVFYLVAADLGGARPAAQLAASAQQVQQRLQTALQEARDSRDWRKIAVGAALSLAATLLAVLLLRGLVALRRGVQAQLASRLAGWQRRLPADHLASPYAGHAHAGARSLAAVLAWGLALLVLDLWATFVLQQFAYTRPWGERSGAWLLGVLQQFGLAMAGAVPGLLTAGLIFVLARLVVRTAGVLMQRIERGELQLGWLDRDTAGPTRRLGAIGVWLFALAMAYPYLPGANSEAFRGLSVLAGLMLSLGASGVVGQAVAGLSLVYTRSLRAGEYVKIGDTEGTVTQVGLFATKIHTGLGEEVSLPNSVIFSQPVRNFSRLVHDGQFMLQSTVTIGYATPWRQVHAMLLEAARRTTGVAADPAPYVVQTALSDFYVEYRLCAQGNHQAPHRRAEAINSLHGHIQDVFNEQGVQIMSPHYLGDPPQPQVVPPGQPWAGPAAAQAPLRPPPPR